MVSSIALMLAMAGYFEPWGKDTDLLPKQEEILFITPPAREDPLSTLSEMLISLHQNHISPTTGPRSNFRPTSSKYMRLAIRRHGFFRGFAMGLDRLLRENDDPWCYHTVTIGETRYKFDPTISY